MLTHFAFRVVIALVLAQLWGCSALYRYDDISAKPERSPANEPMQALPSTLQPSLTIPLVALENAANTAAGKLLPVRDGGSQEIARIEIKLPWPIGCVLCASLDANWNFTVTQPNPIHVEGAANKVAIALPAVVGGQAGFRGDLAKIFSLDKKNFGGAVVAKFATGVKSDINYCVKLDSPSLDYAWTTDPFVEIVGQNCVAGVCVGPWRLNLRDEVDRAIRPAMVPINSSFQNAIPCSPIRDAIANAWKTYSLPIQLPYENLYLNIQPSALFFPGFGVSSTDLTLAGRFDATVSLDPSPLPVNPIPLPSNTPSAISPGKFSIAVPISTKYYTFEALAKQTIVGQKLASADSFGGFVVTPTEVTVYPTESGQALAIGVSVAVEFRYLFFLNTSGTVWLTAKPRSLDNGKRIRMSDVKVTRKFSSRLWDIASVLLDDKITAAVRDGFEVDLGPPLSQASTRLTKAIEDAGQNSGIVLKAQNVSLSVGRMLANDHAFQLEVLVDATVDMRLGSIALK